MQSTTAKDLTKLRTALEAKLERLKKNRSTMDNFIGKLLPGENVSPAVLKEVMALNSDEGERLFNETVQTQEKLDEVNIKIREENNRLAEEGQKKNDNKLRSKVTVNIWAKEEGTLSLVINYSKHKLLDTINYSLSCKGSTNASWKPRYDARLKSTTKDEGKPAKISYKAVIAQSTGEVDYHLT
jgi:hypothetical protein